MSSSLNIKLSAFIINSSDEITRAYCSKVCLSKKFLDSPANCMLGIIIKKGGKYRSSEDDFASRPSIIEKIPDFTKQVTTPEYLEKFAEKYFEVYPNRSEIMDIFKKSLLNPQFLDRLQQAQKFAARRNFFKVQCQLEKAMTIFPLSANLEEYAEENSKLVLKR